MHEWTQGYPQPSIYTDTINDLVSMYDTSFYPNSNQEITESFAACNQHRLIEAGSFKLNQLKTILLKYNIKWLIKTQIIISNKD